MRPTGQKLSGERSCLAHPPYDWREVADGPSTVWHGQMEPLMRIPGLMRVAVATITAASVLYPGVADAASKSSTTTTTSSSTPAFSDRSYTATAATMADVRRIIRADAANAAGYTGN